ncbi:hypothetical protein J3Q64DRAFT_1743841 [Phycomyces blakesleeanus]|uniref:Uncharacterized protein n=1 Tax=Phycomyces blakesleeanus TaxID=4837 RepID=A0ABR3AZE2_PHYBL
MYMWVNGGGGGLLVLSLAFYLTFVTICVACSLSVFSSNAFLLTINFHIYVLCIILYINN